MPTASRHSDFEIYRTKIPHRSPEPPLAHSRPLGRWTVASGFPSYRSGYAVSYWGPDQFRFLVLAEVNPAVAAIRARPETLEWFDGSKWTEGNHIWLMGQRLRRGDMGFTKRRWCPECFRETGVHHTWWDIDAVTTCPEHSCALVESCICGMAVTWRNAGFYNCVCGRVLAHAPAKRLAASECVSDAYVIGTLTGKRPTPPCMLDRLPLDEAIATMEAVGRFILDPHSEGLGKKSRREVRNAGYAVVSNPWAGFAGALEGAERQGAPVPGFPAPVYSDEFRYWLAHRQPDALDGAVSWFFGPARAEPFECQSARKVDPGSASNIDPS